MNPVKGFLAILICFCCVSCAADAGTDHLPMLGGPCEYERYPGMAEIVSLSKLPESNDQYEIKYIFHPETAIHKDLPLFIAGPRLILMDNFFVRVGPSQYVENI